MKRIAFLIFISLSLGFAGCGLFTPPMSKAHLFYNAIYGERVELAKELLDGGANPNKCAGDAGWVDGNPLKVVAEGFRGTLYGKQTETFDDVAMLNLLIDYGADINRLPYVWSRVYLWGNADLESSVESAHKHHNDELAEGKDPAANFVGDSNRLLKAMLERGMNPNMKGHPVPYTHSLRLLFFTDKAAFKYFNSPEATTPLYEAIKKGILWESQVDLLLEYGAALDESCMEAAKLSGDDAMIEKVERLMRQ